MKIPTTLRYLKELMTLLPIPAKDTKALTLLHLLIQLIKELLPTPRDPEMKGLPEKMKMEETQKEEREERKEMENPETQDL